MTSTAKPQNTVKAAREARRVRMRERWPFPKQGWWEPKPVPNRPTQGGEV